MSSRVTRDWHVKPRSSYTLVETLFLLSSRAMHILENFRTYLLVQPLFLVITRWQKPPFVTRYLGTVLIVLAVSLVHAFIDTYLVLDFSYIIFTFAVVISAWYGGLGTGLFATLLCILSGIYLPTEPESAIHLSNSEEQLRVALFIMQGAFISLLSESVQDATRWQSVILESISDSFITFDRNMRFMYLNTRAEQLLGFDRRMLLGKRFIDLFPAQKKSLVYKCCREAIQTKRTRQFEYYSPEDEHWYDVRLYPTSDGVSCYCQDITRRKRFERRLHESRRQFRRFVDANIIGVVIEDLEGNIYEANDIFLRMVGYSRRELEKGKINWQAMTPPEYREIDETAKKALLLRGTVPPQSKELIKKDGQRLAVVIGGVLLKKTKRTQKAMAFYLDITEQKESERKKNEFISIASHELKTPLTSVKAFTEILKKRFEQTKDKKTLYFLDNIESQVDRLTQLVSDLLDISKIEEGKLSFEQKPFSLDILVKKIIVDFQYTTTSHTITKVGESRHLVLGDEHRMEQVLINLISNAIKYSPKSEKVIVKVRDVKDTVEVSVQDFGEGIPSDEKERIFERFFRSRKHEGVRIAGFGLGLYITKEIIEKHHGTIRVESTEGKGSTFTLRIPVFHNGKK